MKLLNKQEIHDILYGSTILGTGGGGSLNKGLQLVDQALDAGKEFKLVSLEELPDEALISTPYKCGSISPETEEERRKYADLPRINEDSALRAFRAMEQHMGQEFYGVVSAELGGGNTAIAFNVGAMLGKYIIDADPAGRSVPELQHTTYYVYGLPITPMAVANEFGDVAIVTEVVNDFRAEALVRAMAVVSKNAIGVVDHPARGKDFKPTVIPGAISYALKIGEAYRQAKTDGQDLATALAQAGNGFVLFRGKVQEINWETKEGFTVGEAVITGEGDYAGSNYKIWFENENIISWRDGVIDVTVPDLICMVDDELNEPVTNPNHRIGSRVSVFGLPSPQQWRTSRGLQVFGPRSFGYDYEFLPIEKKFGK